VIAEREAGSVSPLSWFTIFVAHPRQTIGIELSDLDSLAEKAGLPGQQRRRSTLNRVLEYAAMCLT
jgi:hypothetical protein